MKKEYERDLYVAKKTQSIIDACYCMSLLIGFISLLLCVWNVKYSFKIFITMVFLNLGMLFLHVVMNKVCEDFEYKMCIDKLTSKDDEFIGAEGSE